MKSVLKSATLAVFGLGLTLALPAAAGPIDLYEACVSVNGTVYDVSSGCGSGGTPASGQSFEVDEPGFGGGGYIGDIFDNFENGTFDNDFKVDLVFGDQGSTPEDISLGLGWDFSLAAGEQAVITYLLSATMPTSGF